MYAAIEIEKEYLAKVSNQITDDEILRMKRGVIIDGRMTSPARVRLIKRDAFSSTILVTIHEGRNRQVRKMVAEVGHQVVSLKRVGFGPIKLGDLPSGQWRRLTEEEVEKLKNRT